MSDSWRDKILNEFTPQVARLTLVADPDGLLLEEGVLQGIHERGFDLIPFEDHIEFRFAYESRYRSRWDRGELTDLVVVLRSAEQTLESLPYDLLQAGRKLFFNLGDLFPNFSYPVVTAIDRCYLDRLYQAQRQNKPDTLGDNATKEFILLHVFGIAPELIRQPSDLLRILLRRHFRGQSLPVVLDERLIRGLQRKKSFKDWPLQEIIPDRAAFFSFLQERWSVFLSETLIAQAKGVKEEKTAYNFEYPGPVTIPFEHDDVRVYIDNLFLEGLLEPVEHEHADKLSNSWAIVGVKVDTKKDFLCRLEKLLENVESTLPAPGARHQEWSAFAWRWAELSVLSCQKPSLLNSEVNRRVEELQKLVDESFLNWCRKRYAGLHNQPPVPPVMLHHIPKLLARRLETVRR